MMIDLWEYMSTRTRKILYIDLIFLNDYDCKNDVVLFTFFYALSIITLHFIFYMNFLLS